MTASIAMILLLIAATYAEFNGHDRPNTGEPGGVIVNLMDWLYDDIAFECETVLSKHGFGGVQVSPVTEYFVSSTEPWLWRYFGNRPWYERHQVASYKIDTPSGNEADFKSMVDRCNKAGIKVYVDVVLNHMTATYPKESIASAGSIVDTVKLEYPAVPYTKADFHQPSCIAVTGDAKSLRNCEFRNLHDLDQSNPCVREKQRALLNKLISFGVAGFRVGYAKFMWPEDLKKLFERLDYLDCDKGFACEARPFIYLDFFGIEDAYTDAYQREYLDSGSVTEYNYAVRVSDILHRNTKPTDFADIEKSWKLMSSDKSIVFVETYETPHESFSKKLISSSMEGNLYKLAVVLMLASPYGQPLITSNYLKPKFYSPPYRVNAKDKPIPTNQQARCGNRWICEHRDYYIHEMLKFRKIAEDEPITNWWWHGQRYQFAFSRGNKGFVLINNDPRPIQSEEFRTGLPKGTYCDIMAGVLDAKTQCSGNLVRVDENGNATLSLESSDVWHGVLVIYVGAKID